MKNMYRERVFSGLLTLLLGVLGLALLGAFAYSLASGTLETTIAPWVFLGTGLFVLLAAINFAHLIITVSQEGLMQQAPSRGGMLAVALVTLALPLTMLIAGCSASPPETSTPTPVASISFAQLNLTPDRYSGKIVSIQGFWFDGFEIVVLSERLEPSSYAPGNVQPGGTLIWVKGGLPEEVSKQLYLQPDNPTGYPAHYGKVELIGVLEYGARYGHLDAYRYQLTVQTATLMPFAE